MIQQSRYQLRLNITIERQESRDVGTGSPFWSPTQERLSVEETLDLGSQDFLGVTAILAQLHEAVTQLKAAQAGDDR